MSNHSWLNRGMAAVAVVAGLAIVPQFVHAQNGRNGDDRYADRYDRNGRYDARTPLSEIDAGTFITIRTRAAIESNRRDGRVYAASVDNDVWDDYRRLAVPAIPRGAPAELQVRTARDGDLILDLDTVVVGGRRYTVASSPTRIDAGQRNQGDNPAAYVGGGALLGTIVGAIAGGGKGAAIGAIAGAAGGAALMTQGKNIRVPAGSVLTFRLDQPLSVPAAARRR